MKTCSLCSALLDDQAGACPRCGIASQVQPRRRHAARLAALTGVAALSLGGAIAWPAVQGRSAACEPDGWVEWHVAMERACLTPAYVCENMTAAKLLEDPEVADTFRRAVRSGEPGAYARLDALVGHLRAAYGCEGTPVRAAPRLPPGHPPIDGPGPALPPGHPPVDAAPRTPVFEAPAVLTI